MSRWNFAAVFLLAICTLSMRLGGEEVMRTYRLIGWGGDARQLWVSNGDSMEEVQLTPFSISPRHTTMSTSLRFHRKEVNPGPEGEPVYTLVAEASFPSGSTDILLFAFPRTGDSLQMVPVDTSLDRFKRASIMVINCTPEPLAFRLSDQVFGLNPLESRVIHFSNPPRQLPVQIATSRNGEPAIAYQTVQRFDGEKRMLLLAFDPSRGGPTVNGEGFAGQIRTLVYSE